jgi:hypothetical protein
MSGNFVAGLDSRTPQGRSCFGGGDVACDKAEVLDVGACNCVAGLARQTSISKPSGGNFKAEMLDANGCERGRYMTGLTKVCARRATRRTGPGVCRTSTSRCAASCALRCTAALYPAGHSKRHGHMTGGAAQHDWHCNSSAHSCVA